MKLKDYLETKGVTQTFISGVTGINKSRLSRMVNGMDAPRPDQIIAIYDATEKHVCIEDWASQFDEVAIWCMAVKRAGRDYGID